MAKALGTQDKVKARSLKKHALRLAGNFSTADLGDRADRIGPELVKTLNELAKLEGWDS